MFKNGQRPLDVAITLKLPPDRASKLYAGYLELEGRGTLNALFNKVGNQVFVLRDKVDLDSVISSKRAEVVGLDSRIQVNLNAEASTKASLSSVTAALERTNLEIRELDAQEVQKQQKVNELDTKTAELESNAEFYAKDENVQRAKEQLTKEAERIFRNDYYWPLASLELSLIDELGSNSKYANAMSNYFSTPPAQRNPLKTPY